jgi:hypothetical protein
MALVAQFGGDSDIDQCPERIFAAFGQFYVY